MVSTRILRVAYRTTGPAWDGLGQDPNRPSVTKRRVTNQAAAASDPNQERERVLGTQRPYSDAWWAVHDEIEAENEQAARREARGLASLPSAAAAERGRDGIGPLRARAADRRMT